MQITSNKIKWFEKLSKSQDPLGKEFRNILDEDRQESYIKS